MRKNSKNVNDRLRHLEQKYAKYQQDRAMEQKSIESRLMRGAVAGLNTHELEHLLSLKEASMTDIDAKPTPEQQAACEAYVRHYNAFLTTGRVQTVFGHPVDYSGEWPEARGTSVGYFLDASWWIEGIGYCLDLHPPKHP